MTATYAKHHNHQQEVQQFQQSTSNSMIDFMLIKAIKDGCNDLVTICNKFRVQRNKLLSSVNNSLYVIEGDKIDLANG